MGLDLGSSKISGGSKQIQKGVIVDNCKIYKVTNESGKEFFDKTYDLAIQIEIDIDKDFYPKMWLRGNFKKENGDIIGWGGAFPIDILFQSVGVYEHLNDADRAILEQKLEIGEIPTSVLKFCEGRSFQALKYVDKLYEGKPSYKFYKFTQIVDEDPQKLVDRFNKDVSNGYVQNFHPEIMDEAGTSFNYGANAEQDVTEVSLNKMADEKLAF